MKRAPEAHVSIYIRIPLSLRQRLENVAEEEERTLAIICREFLEDGVCFYEKRKEEEREE